MNPRVWMQCGCGCNGHILEYGGRIFWWPGSPNSIGWNTEVGHGKSSLQVTQLGVHHSEAEAQARVELYLRTGK